MYPVEYLKRSDLVDAADKLGVSVAVVKAVAAVEARAGGFITGTDLPCILFEGHQFHKFTRGVHSRDYPHLSYPRWTKEHYKGGRGEYDRLVEAIRISQGDPEPALKATSWGMFQIMGFNHRAAGYETVGDMVNDFAMGEGAHLRGFVAFIESEGLARSLREQDWEGFAERYNGPGYKANAYDTKLAAEFALARKKREDEEAGVAFDLERGDMMTVQSALNLALGQQLVVDGWIGKNTRAALRAFQRREGLPETGAADLATCEKLGIDLRDYEG